MLTNRLPEKFCERLAEGLAEARPPAGLKNNADNLIYIGERNNTLLSFAGSMRQKGLEFSEIEPALQAVNLNRCSPPLEETEVRTIAESVSRYEPSRSYPFTDIGNAKRLVDQFGTDILYCPAYKSWFIWNGEVWQKDESNQIMERAEMVVEQIRTEAAAIPKDGLKNKMFQHAKTSGQLPRMKAMISLAQRSVSVSPDDFDGDSWLFNCQNGTVDLRTGQLRRHERDDLMTKMPPVAFDPAAECPRWTRFLSQIMAENENLISYLRRVMGYCLTGSTAEQVLFFLIGNGANGKSTLLSVLMRIMGDYTRQADFESFLVKNSSHIRNDLARLKGARLVSASEVDAGGRLSEPLIKQITGGDPIPARFLFKEYFEYIPTFKVLLVANHKPTIVGNEHAIWRRIQVIPFNVTISEQDRDPRLLDALTEELPGIFNWMLQGCLEWQSGGLRPPGDVLSAGNEYREDMDRLGEFLNGDYVVEPGNDRLTIMSRELYGEYRLWCSLNHETPVSQRVFNKMLQERGLRKARRTTSGAGHGQVYWFGISRNDHNPQPVGGDAGEVGINDLL